VLLLLGNRKGAKQATMASTTSASPQQQQQQDPEKVAMLVSMGFEFSAAATALDLCGGHLEQAANHLLMGGGQMSEDDTGATVGAAASTTAVSSHPRGGENNHAVLLVSAPISQYSVDNGRSACTCIALYAAQEFLKQQQRRQLTTCIKKLTAEFLQNAILQGVAIYNAMRNVDPTVEHKSAEEVLQTASTTAAPSATPNPFASLCMPDTIQQGMLSRSADDHPQSLYGLLAASQDATEWTCVLVTKTPGE
jgi:UBA/TS-N domain